VSENVQKTLAEAGDVQASYARGDRITSVVIAIAAVLAALGTLLAHHRSISALTTKNQAILSQARASDAYGKYEAKQVRYQVAQTLIASGILNSEKGHRALTNLADKERESAGEILEKAQTLEAASERDDERSDEVLKSYEVLQLATTLFDVSVVLASIATLVRLRALLAIGGSLSIVGLILLFVGYFRA
jgi:hypothetical protein